MSRAFANLGLAAGLILAAAFLTRSLGLELHVLNATMVSEIDAARLLVHLVGAGEHCVKCAPNAYPGSAFAGGSLPRSWAATIDGNDNVRTSGVVAATVSEPPVSTQPPTVSMTRQPAHVLKRAARYTKIADARPPLSLAPPIPAGR